MKAMRNIKSPITFFDKREFEQWLGMECKSDISGSAAAIAKEYGICRKSVYNYVNASKKAQANTQIIIRRKKYPAKASA